MKIVTREVFRVGQNMSYHLVSASLTVLALEETFLSMCRSSRAIIFPVTDVSVTLRPPCLCPSEGHKHGVSIQSSINLGDTLLQITRE